MKCVIIPLRHTLTTHFRHQPFVWFPYFPHKKTFFFNSIKHTRANSNIASNVQIMAKLLKFTFKRVVLQFYYYYTVEVPAFFRLKKMKIKFYFKSRGSKNKTSTMHTDVCLVISLYGRPPTKFSSFSFKYWAVTSRFYRKTFIELNFVFFLWNLFPSIHLSTSFLNVHAQVGKILLN